MKINSIIVVLFLLGCNASSIGSLDPSVGGADVAPIADGKIADMSYPLEGTQNVSLHADRKLKMNTSCTKILMMRLVQDRNYIDTLIELKNRAALIGGNSVSLVGWKESVGKTGVLGNIYICEKKTYHVHPHPSG